MKKAKHPYEVKVFWSKEDNEWIAIAPELPGCSASGKTRDVALREMETAMELWLESRRESGWSVPRPIAAREIKGKILIRLPKDLHRELLEQAAEQGISLNQFCLWKLTGPWPFLAQEQRARHR